ncbi:ABC transporter permease [Marinococcus halotolerans]|uniref:ABC transporter permease n=1 Tax=Marinococcus halotolerans TaxID=301092 RepID=UPI0003B4AD3E|nr:ABC transporter permease subunit [Marinococcus halotolerans]
MKRKAAAAAFALCFAVPLLALIIQSFAAKWPFGEIWPLAWTLDGWRLPFGDPLLAEAWGRTILIALCVAALNLVIGIPAAKALVVREFRGKELIDAMLLIPVLLPVTALAVGLHIFALQSGTANTWYGVAFFHLLPTLPYTIRIIRAGYERIGRGQYEQSRSLGGGAAARFLLIELPQMTASVRTAVFFAVVISVSQFALTVIIGGGTVTTMAVLYYPYTNSAAPSAVSAFSLMTAALPAAAALAADGVLRVSTKILKSW